MKRSAIEVLHANAPAHIAVVHGSRLKINIACEFQVPRGKDDRRSRIKAQLVARKEHIKAAGIHGHEVVEWSPIGLIEQVNGNGDGALQSSLIPLPSISIMPLIVQDHVPSFCCD